MDNAETSPSICVTKHVAKLREQHQLVFGGSPFSERLRSSQKLGLEKLDLRHLADGQAFPVPEAPGSGNSEPQTDTFSAYAERVRILDFGCTRMERLPAAFLHCFRCVERLVLSSCQLAGDGGLECLRELRLLRQLGLRDNSLTCIPDIFMELQHLETLLVDQNYLEELPESLGSARRLTCLVASSNNLQALPAQWAPGAPLRTLHAEYNRIRIIPETFGQLRALETLNLRWNLLEFLPDSLFTGRLSEPLPTESKQSSPVSVLVECVRIPGSAAPSSDRCRDAPADQAQLRKRQMPCISQTHTPELRSEATSGPDQGSDGSDVIRTALDSSAGMEGARGPGQNTSAGSRPAAESVASLPAQPFASPQQGLAGPHGPDPVQTGVRPPPIKWLILSHNALQSLPESIGCLGGVLELLDLGSNLLSGLPDSLRLLTGLVQPPGTLRARLVLAANMLPPSITHAVQCQGPRVVLRVMRKHRSTAILSPRCTLDSVAVSSSSKHDGEHGLYGHSIDQSSPT